MSTSNKCKNKVQEIYTSIIVFFFQIEKTNNIEEKRVRQMISRRRKTITVLGSQPMKMQK